MGGVARRNGPQTRSAGVRPDACILESAYLTTLKRDFFPDSSIFLRISAPSLFRSTICLALRTNVFKPLTNPDLIVLICSAIIIRPSIITHPRSITIILDVRGPARAMSRAHFALLNTLRQFQYPTMITASLQIKSKKR